MLIFGSKWMTDITNGDYMLHEDTMHVHNCSLHTSQNIMIINSSNCVLCTECGYWVKPVKIMFEAHGSNKSNFCFLVATSARTKDETFAAELKSQNNFESQNNFVRAYRDRTGSNATNSGMRMSMAIRPQTVSSLASKFDSIIHDKSHTSKSNSHQLKLRTYDISKIITELNRPELQRRIFEDFRKG